MKAVVFAVPLLAMVGGCATYSDAPAVSAPLAATINSETETARINAWFAEKWEEELAFSPMRQTELGIKTDYDKLDDFSVAGRKALIAWWQDAAAELEARFDYAALSQDAQISYDMFKFRAKEAAEEGEYLDRQFILEQMDGAHTTVPTFILSQHTVESESDMEAFVARLGGLAIAMDQSLERARANARAGTRPPRFAYDFVIKESEALISGAPFDDGEPSALWDGTLTRLDALVDSRSITEDRADELRNEARAALLEKVGPAYQRIVDWMTVDRPNSDEIARGVDALPDGKAYYAYRLRAMTTTDMSADEIHELGLSEVARIRGEMERLKEQVGFDGTLEDFFVFVREDPQFFFPNNDAGAQMYIDRATQYIETLTTRLPEFFGRLPKARLVVRRVESFREKDGAAQHYRSGTPDGSRPGIYYAHLSDMNAMPIPEIETIAYHEGNPGHHMQVSIAQELTELPRFQANGGYIPAFGEGWGLYSEALAKEMGGFKDPYQDFGRLQNEIWRAIRLVVDTGIHAKGWSEQQANDYALANSANPETATRSEVQRYFVLPGQATSYKIGMIRIQQLRARAEQELGETFDIRGFHDTVLGGGDMPLHILEKRVGNWIAAQKEG